MSEIAPRLWFDDKAEEAGDIATWQRAFDGR